MDELLASIRQAIHDRVEPGRAAARAPVPKLVHATPAPGESATGAATDAGRMKRTIVTSGREGFAGLLGGDVRLEEALARLNNTGGRGGVEASAAGEAPAAVAEKLRPTIAEWTGGRASPVAAAPVAATPEKAAASRWPGVCQQIAPDRTERRHEEPLHRQRPVAPERPIPAKDLLSSQAASAAHAAFNRLTTSNADRSPGRERGLDEMTRDCLRPLLKDWLDRNLPDLVERLVRKEIERVARSGR